MTCIRPVRIVSLILLLSCVLASMPGRAAGQQPGDIKPGSRVRIKLEQPSAAWVPGRLEMATADSLRLVTEAGDTLSTPAAAVAALEVSQGEKSSTWTGALIGGSLAVGFGLAVGIAASQDDFLEAEPGAVFAGTVILGAGGALVGGLIGSLFKSEKWTNVPRPWLAIRPSKETLGVEVGFAWSLPGF